jgi:fatty-acyl-CoA synthase
VRKAVVSADEITRHVSAQLARFKVPREVIFLDALPRNALGKVQHFVLRQEAARRS